MAVEKIIYTAKVDNKRYLTGTAIETFAVQHKLDVRVFLPLLLDVVRNPIWRTAAYTVVTVGVMSTCLHARYTQYARYRCCKHSLTVRRPSVPSIDSCGRREEGVALSSKCGRRHVMRTASRRELTKEDKDRLVLKSNCEVMTIVLCIVK